MLHSIKCELHQNLIHVNINIIHEKIFLDSKL